ncbi:MAG: hypothetical protein ACE15C_13690 [Phycisphaerae bacterium]
MSSQRHKSPIPPELLSVASVVNGARAAMVRQEWLDAAGRAFFHGAIAAALAVVIARLAGMPGGPAWWLLLIAPGAGVAGTIWRKARGTAVPDGYRVAKQIDDRLKLKDRLAGGYDLLRSARAPGGLERTAFTALILKDAAAAADEARRAMRAAVRLPRGLVPGLLCLALSAAISAFLLPGSQRQGTGAEISSQQREQVRAFNDSLARMAESIKAIEGLDDKQAKEMLDALRSVQISEDELKKMSQADIIRRLRDANAKLKLPEGAQGAALRQAIEDKNRAIAEMEQVQKQLEEIAAINSRQAVIDLGDGRTAAAANIKLESSDLQIDQAIAAAAAGPGEAEQEYQKRIAAADARAKAEREAIKKFLAKTGTEDVPPAEAQKLAQMMASDAEFQGKVMEAIKDPSGKKLAAMREIYRRQLDREFEKENIPRGLRQQLNTYLGPAEERK